MSSRIAVLSLVVFTFFLASCGTGSESDEPSGGDTGHADTADAGADTEDAPFDATPDVADGADRTDGVDDSGEEHDGAHPDTGPAEVCDNGLDDDEDGSIDCLDEECTSAPRCEFVDLDSNRTHSCGALASGEVVCWGSNGHGKLANGLDEDDSYPPKFVAGIDSAERVTTGREHSCASLADGTVRCWGANRSGQLGDDSLVDAPTPVEVVDLDGVIDVAAGRAHSCALRMNGEVWCWGNNRDGQAGAGRTQDPDPEPAPVRVGLTNFDELDGATKLDAGYNYSCAIDPDLDGERVVCWGDNVSGQLGSGSSTDSMYAGMTVEYGGSDLLDATSIATGDYSACALREGGDIVCWGDGRSGQLGSKTYDDSQHSAIDFDGLSDGNDIWMGDVFGCAERSSGQVVCWGRNSGLAFGPETERYEQPIRLEGADSPREMALSESRTCWIDSDGALFCRGWAILHLLGVSTNLDIVADPQRIVPTFDPR